MNLSGQRFVLLEHTGHPDDPNGRHYDLLLEEAGACQTWRLDRIPAVGGPAVSAERLPPHRLAWLDTEAAEVSGNRGFARRIDAGTYGSPEPGSRQLTGKLLAGRLRLERTARGWQATLG